MKFRTPNFHDCHELHNRYAGGTIWIVGSDPSLTDYPDDFLDDKVGITLHFAHAKFPRATFRYTSEQDRSRYLKETYPEYSRQPLICSYPTYGVSRAATADLVRDFDEVYFHEMVPYLPTGLRGRIDEAYTRYKVRQTQRGAASVWGAHGSCLHTCVYMAILMGAADIHVISSGHGMYGGGRERGGLEHFAAMEAAHEKVRPGYKSFDEPTDSVPTIEQTLALQRACFDSGINFFWHHSYSPAMDRYIQIDAAWFAQRKRQAVRRFGLARTIYRNFLKRPYTLLFISRR